MSLTPMMQQYQDAKTRHPGMIVLFRNGDFYELFEDDAELGSKLLGLTLTKRDKHIPMAGFPHPQLERYVGKFIQAGHRVAVCEQVEQPDAKTKLIRREVTRVITPGTVTEEELLDPRQPNYLLAIHYSKSDIGLAWVDLSTGSFWACDSTPEGFADDITRINSAECLISDSTAEKLPEELQRILPRTRSRRPDWTFDSSTAVDALKKHFAVKSFAGFGFSNDQAGLVAAGAIIFYLQEMLKASLGHVRKIEPFFSKGYLMLDEVTRRSLELTRTMRDGQRDGSLLSIIDRTVTPMGARFLHDAILAPLNNIEHINARLDGVQELLSEFALRGELRLLLDATSDLQRLTARISTRRANPKDLAAVQRTLRQLPKLKARLAGRKSALLSELEGRLELCHELREAIDSTLTDDPPFNPSDGGVIRTGCNTQLDELRSLASEGKNWIARYQAQEITRSGINSLKVGYNSVFGYYIEITNIHTAKVPADYIRKQTLKNAERYITPELKEYEEKVLTAEERALALEQELFAALREQAATEIPRLLNTAEVLARLDFLAGLAELASERGYIRPILTEEPILEIIDGRHPVLDQTLPPGTFVPNDAALHPAESRFWLITGPNMSGKSTFIRQVALLTLLAHVGSYVPAKYALVGRTDRIFTRVGAADELNRGLSTFMVEMTEAANILNNATPNSLVILDEIGRGTSTYDGVSLAWAITEHLHDYVGCRTLFATHYHELAQLSETLTALKNYHVQVTEDHREIVFLHKISPGFAERSYGIHVAKLAGVPESVLKRAEGILTELESRHALPEAQRPKLTVPPEKMKKLKRERVITGPTLFTWDEGPEETK
ncbi:DNA mismatch repair protein MutS [Telmatocola sphagniphila]|uniref:DNA mismatch repair protein MutS n=1 Tax=Telmatocola sphagniphila TaxID=1123043 RepID=A0A8E6B357_9BACT|nr:DNA mismatch repair protein MutS [Telmatocola sphagniphila]QVL31320.1 DNA mismatch repair protein MutS [Telmatocola sphagniphila]